MYSKILNTFLFLFSNKILVIRAVIHKMLVKIANREDPDWSLIWFCTVYMGFLGRQQVFKILEHLPKYEFLDKLLCFQRKQVCPHPPQKLKFHLFSSVVNLKIRARSPKPNKFFITPNVIFMKIWLHLPASSNLPHKKKPDRCQC